MIDTPWQRTRAALPADALVAGVDEVGRGPLVGDVVAAAVVLGPWRPPGLTDSKRLSPVRRDQLRALIERHALAVAIGRASAQEIDRLNILQATLLAMQRAVASLPLRPALVLVDGNRLPAISYPALAVVRGDTQVPEISAASIVAKECRDLEMHGLDERFPGYGFAAHKGYPTRQHLEALARLGPICEHRRSFRPVRELLIAKETHDRYA